MSTSWVRLWRDMPNDPKWRTIAKKAGRPVSDVVSVFVTMMAAADENGALQGWNADDVASGLDLDPTHVAAICSAMQGKVLNGEELTGWDKRQPKREDGSAERAKAWRERKRTQANAEKRPDTDTDTDTEVTTVRSEAAREEPDGRTPLQVDLKRAFNGSTEMLLAAVETAMGGNCRPNAEQWLASTMSAHGAQAVAQAYAAIVEKQATGVIVARFLPHWSNVAAGIKAGRPPAGDSRPAWAKERDAKREAFMTALKAST